MASVVSLGARKQQGRKPTWASTGTLALPLVPRVIWRREEGRRGVERKCSAFPRVVERYGKANARREMAIKYKRARLVIGSLGHADFRTIRATIHMP